MGKFQGGDNRGGGFRGGNGGGGRPFQNKSWGGNDRGASRDRGEVTMHKATCGDCGKGCEVPFRPTGEKPVYCSDCFGSKREGGDRGGRRDFDSRGPKREFSNDRPSPRPDFRPQATQAQAPVSNDGTAKHLAEISMKLDRLTNAVTRLLDDKIQKEVIKVAPVASKVESKSASVKTAKKSAPAKSAKKVVSKKKK